MTRVVLITGAGAGLGLAAQMGRMANVVVISEPEAVYRLAEHLPDPERIPAMPGPPTPVARQIGYDGHRRRHRGKGRNRRRW